MTACAITDHEVAYGQVDFYKKKGTRRHLFTNYVRFSKFEALELYEITPFSNTPFLTNSQTDALELYEITPFSNIIRSGSKYSAALELYEITPFSNGAVAPAGLGGCFRTIQIYIILKHEDNLRVLLQFWISTNLHHSQTMTCITSRMLWF